MSDCLAAPAALRKVFVDGTTGDDTNDGTCQAAQTFGCGPVKSLSRALALKKPGDAVVLAAGAYPEPLTVSVSGTAEAPIVIEAGAGSEVFVRGTWTLEGASFIVLRGLRFEAPLGLGWLVTDRASHHVRVVGNSFDSSNPTAADFIGARLRGAKLEVATAGRAARSAETRDGGSGWRSNDTPTITATRNHTPTRLINTTRSFA